MDSSINARRVLMASLVGSAIEWFDFFLYGTAAALVFNKLFFPSDDPLISLLLAYLSFGIPFFIRPLGGVVFAHIGDRIGRKKTLVMTLLLMGTGTTLIGLLPTHADIGIAAPMLLVLLRLVQGLGLGGEWGGAILLAYESAPPARRALFASVPQAGVTIGMMLATAAMGLVSLLPDDAFMAWGWRIPFLLSAVLVILGFWMRNGVDETQAFKALQNSKRVARYPLVELLKSYRWQVLRAILVKFGETATFYVFAVFLVSYATESLGYARITVLIAVAVGALVASIAIPLWGRVADSRGPRTVFAIGSVGLIVFAAPFFWLLSARSTLHLFAATTIALGLIWPLVTAPLSTLLADLFPVEVRYSGISLGYQLGAAIAGGTAPFVATLLLSFDEGRWGWIAGYMMAMAFVSLLSVGRRTRTHRQRRRNRPDS